MRKNEYSVDSACEKLSRNGVIVNLSNLTIVIGKEKHVGLKLLGAVDFLVSSHNFVLIGE